MDWFEAVEIISPYVVRIRTPSVSGTGFLVADAANGTICGVATAAHVIRHAHDWEEPIRIQHHESGESVLLRVADRAIVIDSRADTAAIIFPRGTLPFPDDLLELSPEGKMLKPGVTVGWVGFPVIVPSNLCFFSGAISSWMPLADAYLVDGVAINGVSGGPAVNPSGQSLTAIGVVSAYMPNRIGGDALPGLCVVQDVKQFQTLVKQFKSLPDAQKEQSPPAPTTEKETPPADDSGSGGD